MANYRGKRADTATTAQKGSENIDDMVDINSTSAVKSVGKIKKYKVVRIVSVALAVLFALLSCGMFYVNSRITDFTDDTTLDNGKDYKVTDDKNENVVTDAKLLENADVLNVMLFGEDTRANETTAGRSDTMILVSLDVKNKQIKMTSFLRDSYVYIPSGDDNEGWNKLNASYSYGGAKLAVKTIESNFGIKIDRYGVIDFAGFRKVIDTLGGVTIPITGTEGRYINAQINHNNQKCKLIPEKYCVSEYKTDSDGNTINDEYGPVEKKKKVKLNGKQALWYARNRGSEEISDEIFTGDDWSRTKRQRTLIHALMNEFKKASFSSIVSAIGDLGPMVRTNFKENEIISLATGALTYLDYPIYQLHVPIGDATDPNKLWAYDKNDFAGSFVRITDWDNTRTDIANFVFKKAPKKYLFK